MQVLTTQRENIFKVVDSDDWVDEEHYIRFWMFWKTFENEEKQVDMLLANYVYEKKKEWSTRK